MLGDLYKKLLHLHHVRSQLYTEPQPCFPRDINLNVFNEEVLTERRAMALGHAMGQYVEMLESN